MRKGGLLLGTDEVKGAAARLVNEQIRSFADDSIDRNDVWEFFCECGCWTLISMRISTYDARGEVWAPGHKPEPAIEQDSDA